MAPGVLPFGGFDLSKLRACIATSLPTLNLYASRSIDTLAPPDNEHINELFGVFLDALQGGKRRSPVAVAKTLHLFGPDLFPLWDTEIAIGYGSWWWLADFAATEYLSFCSKMKRLAEHVNQCNCARNPVPKKSVLKLIDEYNYSRFTKGWV